LPGLDLSKCKTKVQTISIDLDNFEKKMIRFEEQEEFAKRLELKDGKCPICDSKVDHLKPSFQKEHVKSEIKSLGENIIQLQKTQLELEENIQEITVRLQKSNEAIVILKTHDISNEAQLQNVIEEIKMKNEKIKDIPITISSGQLVVVSSIDSLAKTMYGNILQFEKVTEGFNQEEFFDKKAKPSGETR